MFHRPCRPRAATTVGLLVLLLAFCGVRTRAADAAGAIPIPNADLEEGDAGPAQWNASHQDDGAGTWAWDAENVHSGKRAFRLRKDNAEGYSELISPFVSVEPGKTYEVTAWIKLHRRSSAGVYFMVSQYRADSDDMQFPNAFSDAQARHSPGAWEQLRLTFDVRPPNTRVRIHALVNAAPCDVTWDGFALGTGTPPPKPFYEPPTVETLPPLEDAKRVLAARKQAEANVEVRDGRPRFVVDGKLTPPCFYVSPFGPKDPAQIGDFRNAGVRVYLVPLVLGHGVYGDRGPWLGPGKYDFAEVDDLLWRVLRVDPEGYIIFYMACDPYKEWGAEHPDEVTQDQNGLKAIVHMHPKRWGGKPPEGGERFGPSLVSEVLREETATTLRALVAYVAQSEPGKAVVGYHVAGSNDGQWFHWTRFDPKDLHLADFSPGAQRSYRNWLRCLYGNDEAALRRAWHRPDVTFDTAALPPGNRVWTDRFLVDPATDQDVIDSNRFYSEGVADTVLHLCRTLREATGGKALLSTYYEDITCNSANHIALGRYLDSPDIDFFAGPAAYGVRLPGKCGAIRSVFGSTLLHGKIYLTEQDWRSWHSVPTQPAADASVGRAETAAAHNAMVRRECGMMLAYGMGTWWYDMCGGWFRDDQIMAAITEARKAFDQDLTVPGVPRADLAVFVSEESDHALYLNEAGHVRHQSIIMQVYDLNTAGVPYRMYLLSDLGRVQLPEHRMYLFLNCYAFSPEQLKAIEALRRDGKMLVFLHAPGVTGEKDAAAAVERVTGIRVRAMPPDTKLGAVPVPGAHPLIADTEGRIATSMGVGNWPAFEVVDEQATPLAYYPKTKSVSVAVKQFPNHQAVFVGSVGLSDQFIWNLAHAAGAWCAAKPGDAVYGSESFLTIHAMYTSEDGMKRLQLARPARVVDLATGTEVSPKTEALELKMQLGETRWFRLFPE